MDRAPIGAILDKSLSQLKVTFFSVLVHQNWPVSLFEFSKLDMGDGPICRLDIGRL